MSSWVLNGRVSKKQKKHASIKRTIRAPSLRLDIRNFVSSAFLASKQAVVIFILLGLDSLELHVLRDRLEHGLKLGALWPERLCRQTHEVLRAHLFGQESVKELRLRGALKLDAVFTDADVHLDP